MDLRAFGAPCAIVEPSEKLRKLDDHARMCVFVGYKYGGGGYRVWDPRRSVVVKSRDVIFFEDSLPMPTYRKLAAQADELFMQPSLGRPAALVPSVTTQPPVLPSVPSSVPATTAVPLPQAVQESQRLTIKLPARVHWDAAKRVLQYLKGTRGWRLRLSGKPLQVMAYTDADWGSVLDDQHSIRAYIVKVGGGAVSWKMKKQTCVALSSTSSTEAEYVALCQAAKESVWMVEFLGGFGVAIQDAMVVNVDNQGGDCVEVAI